MKTQTNLKAELFREVFENQRVYIPFGSPIPDNYYVVRKNSTCRICEFRTPEQQAEHIAKRQAYRARIAQADADMALKKTQHAERVKFIRQMCKDMGICIRSYVAIDKIIDLYYDGLCRPITPMSKGYTNNTDDILLFANTAKIGLICGNDATRGGRCGYFFQKMKNLELIAEIERLGVKITEKNGNSYVEGDLDLSYCTGLTELPKGLNVGRDLYLRGCTGLTELPKGLSVGGSLYLSGCTRLTELPDGLSVGGRLYLYDCTGLTELPKGLNVEGYLDLYGCTGLKSNSNYLFSKEIGSRESITVYFIKEDLIKCGCFTGTLSEFEKRVHEVYADGVHRDQYDEFITKIKKIKI